MAEVKKPNKETKVLIEIFNGRPTFGIWEVDPAGNKKSERPIISFGKVKADYIMKHIEDLKDFVELN